MTEPTATAVTIRRYEIPVDDQWHTVELTDLRILHVAARRPDTVEFWTWHYPGCPNMSKTFRVFGTGQPLPVDWERLQHHGTAIAADGRLVWHLFEYVDGAAQ